MLTKLDCMELHIFNTLAGKDCVGCGVIEGVPIQEGLS